MSNPTTSPPSQPVNTFKRWGWRSTVARLTLLVTAVSVMSLLLHIMVMFLLANTLASEISSAIVTAIRYDHQKIVLTTPDQRQAVVQSLVTPNQYVLSGGTLPARQVDVNKQPSFEWIPKFRLLQELQRTLGPDIVVTTVPQDQMLIKEALRFSFLLDGQVWHIIRQPIAPISAAVGTLVGWVALIGLGVFASLTVGIRLIDAPINQIVAQIGDQEHELKTLVPPKAAGPELEHLVSTFNQLVESNQRAQALKQQLLAGVSHDLRTPLARLRLRIETQCEPEVAEALRADTLALERIVAQFLGYVQGENHVSMGQAWPLSETITRVVTKYRSDDAAPQTVFATLNAVDFSVADLAIERALTNLIDNALDYGRPPIEVTLEEQPSQAGPLVVLTVWDHGSGISATEFERAKSPFVRLGANDQTLGHCGLGLAIVAQVAQQTHAQLNAITHIQGKFGISLSWYRTAHSHAQDSAV